MMDGEGSSNRDKNKKKCSTNVKNGKKKKDKLPGKGSKRKSDGGPNKQKTDKVKKKRFASAPAQQNIQQDTQDKKINNKNYKKLKVREAESDLIDTNKRRKHREHDKSGKRIKNKRKSDEIVDTSQKKKKDRDRIDRSNYNNNSIFKNNYNNNDNGEEYIRDVAAIKEPEQETDRVQSTQRQETDRLERSSQLDKTDRNNTSKREKDTVSKTEDKTQIFDKKTNSDEIVDLLPCPAKPETPPILFNVNDPETDPKNPYQVPLGAVIGTERCSYYVVKKLGSGGCGEAFIVQHAKTKKRYAVKTEFANVEEKRLRREFDIYRRINQFKKVNRKYLRHLLQVIDFGECEGVAQFLFLPLCDGSLETFTKEPRFPTLQTAFEICVQAMESIYEFHCIGYIHRDIKPANFVLNASDNRVYLIDFGMSAKSITESANMPNTSVYDFIGTIRYACRNAHRGVPQTRKDDLEAWFYVILELFDVNLLDWSQTATNEEVANMKDVFWSGKSMIKLEQTATCLGNIYRLIKDMDRFERPDYEQIFFELKREALSRKLKVGRAFDFSSTPSKVLEDLKVSSLRFDPSPRINKEQMRKPFKEPSSKGRSSPQKEKFHDALQNLQQPQQSDLLASNKKIKNNSSDDDEEELIDVLNPSKVKIDKKQKR